MRRTEFMLRACDPKTLTVHQLMEDNVVTCSPQTSALSVAQILTEGNFGSVPVVDEHRTLLGIVTEFDLLNVMNQDKDLEKVTAEDMMTQSVVTVTEEMPVLDLIKLLQDQHLIRVPVVKGRTLVGIVARRDIVFGYVKALGHYWP